MSETAEDIAEKFREWMMANSYWPINGDYRAVEYLTELIDAALAEPQPDAVERELAEAELRLTLHTKIVSRCINAACEWHERVYLKDNGARQSLMAAVAKAGMQGLDNVMLKENVFSSYLAFLATKTKKPQPDAMEMVNTLEGIFNVELELKPKARQAAAALLDEWRTVPRAMLYEVEHVALETHRVFGHQHAGPANGYQTKMTDEQFDAIAAKHGVKVGG